MQLCVLAASLQRRRIKASQADRRRRRHHLP